MFNVMSTKMTFTFTGTLYNIVSADYFMIRPSCNLNVNRK